MKARYSPWTVSEGPEVFPMSDQMVILGNGKAMDHLWDTQLCGFLAESLQAACCWNEQTPEGTIVAMAPPASSRQDEEDDWQKQAPINVRLQDEAAELAALIS